MVAIAILLAGLLVPATARADSSPQPLTFTTFLSFAGWKTYPSGGGKGLGDLSVFTGSVSTSFGGSTAGSYAITTRVVDRQGKGKATIDTRDTRVQVTLARGSVLAQGMTEDPREKPPTGLHILPVVGGTGDYASARGTLVIRSLGSTGVYSLAYAIFVDRRWTEERHAVAAAVAAWVGVDDTAAPVSARTPGDTFLATHESPGRTLVIASTLVAAAGKERRYSQEVLLTTTEGLLIARGEQILPASRVPGRTEVSYAVLGGTGAYAGRRGVARVIPSASGEVDIRLRLSPPRTTRVARQVWFERGARSAAAQTFQGRGGVVDASIGTMRTDARDGRTLGAAIALTRQLATTGGGWLFTSAEQTFGEGTMMLAGVTADSIEGRTWVVIGGTGNYGGAAGSATGVWRSGAWSMRAAYWR